jgi:hypothetical protein
MPAPMRCFYRIRVTELACCCGTDDRCVVASGPVVDDEYPYHAILPVLWGSCQDAAPLAWLGHGGQLDQRLLGLHKPTRIRDRQRRGRQVVPLSRSSIVARECGIPAVMDTGVAKRRICSGQGPRCGSALRQLERTRPDQKVAIKKATPTWSDVEVDIIYIKEGSV